MSAKKPLYAVLSSLVQARANCLKSGNAEWLARHTARLVSLVREHMPSGSGFDTGTSLDLEASEPNALVFHVGYHHMNEVGFYTHWTDHKITARPDFTNGVRLAGCGRGDHGDYVHEVFHGALTSLVSEFETPETPSAPTSEVHVPVYTREGRTLFRDGVPFCFLERTEGCTTGVYRPYACSPADFDTFAAEACAALNLAAPAQAEATARAYAQEREQAERDAQAELNCPHRSWECPACGYANTGDHEGCAHCEIGVRPW